MLGTLGVLVAPHLGVPMVLYPLFGLGLCTVMLHGQGLPWADTGFNELAGSEHLFTAHFSGNKGGGEN
ncbi:hypothetical protein ACFWZ1_14950 [Frateuria sp. GZRe14]|uniref:hypothetical protein n=1 Tax=Frateuria sp. GZRe14 TaxID=3351534 RepID=UPI003EDBDC80